MPNQIAHSAIISSDVVLGDNVTVMENAIVRANVNVGDYCIIGSHCVIGEYQSGFYHNADAYRNPSTKIGPGSVIRSHSVIYSGTIIGKEFHSGHHVVVRENSSFGDHCLFGNFCQTDESVRVGDYVRCHSRVFLTGGMEIRNYSCLYPNVTTSDVRYPPYRNRVLAPKIGERVVIGSGVVLLSGVSVGNGAFVAAGSLVSRDIPAGMFAIGRPARSEKRVEEIRIEGLGIETPYPFDPAIIRDRKKNK